MTHDALSEGQITAAIEWWVKALGHPKYDALGPRRGDGIAEYREREPMEMASIMMLTYGEKLTAEQIDAFAAHLRDVLTDRCEHTWSYNGHVHPIRRDRVLCVDYDPDPVLRHCGEIAGFPPAFFWPIKTTMWVTNGCVRVRYGYGAEIETIYEPAGGAPTQEGA